VQPAFRIGSEHAPGAAVRRKSRHFRPGRMNWIGALMNNRNSIITIVVIVVLVLIGLFFFFNPNSSNENAGESQHLLDQDQ
jgi:hypothetical protein